MSTFVGNQTLSTVTCCKCGVMFAMPEEWQVKFRQNHEHFYCPAGHSQHYTGETEEEKLRQKVARLQTNIEHKEKYELELQNRNKKLTLSCAAVRGVVTRIKNRVGAGVCPCCKRTFGCLARHMETQHPEFRQSPT